MDQPPGFLKYACVQYQNPACGLAYPFVVAPDVSVHIPLAGAKGREERSDRRRNVWSASPRADTIHAPSAIDPANGPACVWLETEDLLSPGFFLPWTARSCPSVV